MIHSDLFDWGNYPDQIKQLSGSGRAHWDSVVEASSARSDRCVLNMSENPYHVLDNIIHLRYISRAYRFH